MSLRLAKALRHSRIAKLPIRGRPGADTEVADEVPHDYYVTKDYERNPFYGAYSHAQRQGYKKLYDPFKKFSERQEHAWVPKYRHQQFDMGGGWLSTAFFILLPLQVWVLFYFESRYRRHTYNPLAHNFGRPSEF